MERTKKTNYIVGYMKSHYKRVPLDLTFDKYDEIKKAAEASNDSVNGWIKKAINRQLETGQDQE